MVAGNSGLFDWLLGGPFLAHPTATLRVIKDGKAMTWLWRHIYISVIDLFFTSQPWAWFRCREVGGRGVNLSTTLWDWHLLLNWDWEPVYLSCALLIRQTLNHGVFSHKLGNWGGCSYATATILALESSSERSESHSITVLCSLSSVWMMKAQAQQETVSTAWR